jgi:Late embryogenesis abundant protein
VSHSRALPVALVLAAVAAACEAAGLPNAASLNAIQLEFPDRGTAHVTLIATPSLPLPSSEFAEHRLILGDTAVPLRSPATLTGGNIQARVSFDVKLADVPQQVLDLPFEQVSVRWFGLDRSGAATVVVAGIMDARDRSMVSVKDDDLRRNFAHLGPVDLSPSLTSLGVRMLLSVYNPFRFDLVATKLSYRLTVGDQPLLDSEHAGFKLRAGQSSDVLLEETVALSSAVTAAAGLMQQAPVALAGTLTLRTPQGERAFPVFLSSAR